MKITQEQAIALFAELGFPQAADWSKEKLAKRLGKVPEKFPEEVLKENQTTLEALALAVSDGEEIEVVDKLDEEPIQVDTAEDLAKLNRDDMYKVIDQNKLEIDPAEYRLGHLREAVAAMLFPLPEEGEEVHGDTDLPQSRKGSMASSVSEVITNKWMTEEKIAELAGVPLQQTRDHLAYLKSKGVVQKIVERKYRVAPWVR